MSNFAKKDLSAYERWELPVLNHAAAGVVWKEKSESIDMPVLPTAEELEAIRLKSQQEGFAEGKKEGYEQGYALGVSDGQQEIKEAVAEFSQLLNHLIEPISQQDEQLEQVLLTMVHNICTQLLKRELLLNSEGVLLVIREALDKITSAKHKVKIYINPKDYSQVEKFLPQQSEYESQWRLLVRDTLTPGGCVIETDHALIDASIHGRLQQWMDQIYQKKSATEQNKNNFISKEDMLLDHEENV